MHIRLSRTAAPAVEPVTEAEAKEQCRVRHSQADLRLARLITSAREQAEGRTRRALITQQWEQSQCPGAACSIPLQRWPVQEVLSVHVDGALLDPSAYRVNTGEEASVTAKSGHWPGEEVVISYQAGYGDDPGDVPAGLRDWMLVHVADAYANPNAIVIGTISGRMTFVDDLLNPFVVPR
ncbi:MAG: hypothetical protein V7756_04855 [Halopseudomonas sp.]|uniref:head-tail connector protein n=1 Tax=Halopseudomonas sp. TaxID=2901191 RepID=UPI00300115EA